VPTSPPQTHEEEMVALHYHPEYRVVPELVDYPAHLHIDVLPDFQGQGHGRRLMAAFEAAVSVAGAAGLHLGMLTTNVKARAFYDRLGFVELPVPDAGPITYLGKPLGR
jgi:GNAT superfamily N-acetyltransferase